MVEMRHVEGERREDVLIWGESVGSKILHDWRPDESPHTGRHRSQ